MWWKLFSKVIYISWMIKIILVTEVSICLSVVINIVILSFLIQFLIRTDNYDQMTANCLGNSLLRLHSLGSSLNIIPQCLLFNKVDSNHYEIIYNWFHSRAPDDEKWGSIVENTDGVEKWNGMLGDIFDDKVLKALKPYPPHFGF